MMNKQKLNKLIDELIELERENATAESEIKTFNIPTVAHTTELDAKRKELQDYINSL